MTMTTLQIKIDEDLKQDFKVCVTKNKENMTDILVDAIKKYVQENDD